MTGEPVISSSIYDSNDQPRDWPTHLHSNIFWEELGRTVATFGFLEEILGRAIFAFTATLDAPTRDFDVAYAAFVSTLQRALSDPLSGLIESYEKAVRSNNLSVTRNLDDFLNRLRDVAKYRNVVCHGSWRAPDAQGASIPLFVTRKNEIWEGPIDLIFLRQLRAHTVDLIANVMSSVTAAGLQFPGSNGPGEPVWSSRAEHGAESA